MVSLAGICASLTHEEVLTPSQAALHMGNTGQRRRSILACRGGRLLLGYVTLDLPPGESLTTTQLCNHPTSPSNFRL